MSSKPTTKRKSASKSLAKPASATWQTQAAATDLAQALKASSPLAAGLVETARRQQAPAAVQVAVILPCYNEALAIADVVKSFQLSLPDAKIFVFDNRSTDNTAEVARAAGAQVFLERRAGKGNVVRRMFAEVDADVYLMCDGDGTYDAASAPQLIKAVTDDHMDMVIGARANIHQEAHRAGHAFGNKLFNGIYRTLFGNEYGDIFSGYRAFSRRFVKSFPALSSGFEIETELSVHASQLKLPTCEISLPYGKRQDGSKSKLNSVRDGLKILKTFIMLAKETRPAMFFGTLSGALVILAAVLAVPLITTFVETGLVPRLPTAILCTGLILVASVFAVAGLILDSLTRFRIENKRILYLAIKKGGI